MTTMASASFQPKENSAKSVMMLLRPSFMPGTGKGMGICASEHEDASAMAGQQRAAASAVHPHGRPSLARLLPNLSQSTGKRRKSKGLFLRAGKRTGDSYGGNRYSGMHQLRL